MDLTGLKSTCCRAGFPQEALGDSVALTSPAFLTLPPPTSQAEPSLCHLSGSLLGFPSPFLWTFCDYFGPAQLIQDQLPTLRSPDPTKVTLLLSAT